ncbi:hypothetical protein Tco_1032256 [Tanacetum coccineum]|uniref:Reverse transcriptase Ty1/copia-type domain-containing protein n=1 Tax=Tanacetum coccineum TaxID=301880 RepID=A0ABQ5GBW0_9ASTR
MSGTQDTNIPAGTQDDSDSECDEQVIVVPSNSFSGPKVHEASQMMESNSDYAEQLARLQRQEHEAKDTAMKYGFSKDTEEHLRQADMVPAGSIDPAASITTDSIDPTTSISTGTHEPFPTVIEPVHAVETSLPPGHSLGSSEHSTRFPSPSDLANSISLSLEMDYIYHHPDTGIFSSSSYDDEFGGTVTNLALSIVVDSVPTKRVNTIHPQTQILGDLTSPVQTRGTLKKSKFSASAFVSYVHDQQRNNHTDYLHCLFACFLSQLEPSSVAQALNDPAWVKAVQEEMQQFINQKVWQLIPLPDGKIAIGIKNDSDGSKRDAKYSCKNKEVVAQGHRLEVGINYDEQKPDGIFISQDKYVQDMLKKFDMESVRPATTPFEASKPKSKDEPDDAVNLFIQIHDRFPKVESFLGRWLISWQCIKDITIVATSSNEAEYVAVLTVVVRWTVADLLTKAFDGPRFNHLVVHIGMLNP